MARKISEKQDIACREYIIDLDRERAYLAAYPNTRPDLVRSKARALFDQIKIQKHIMELKAQRLDRLEMTADSVLQKIAEVVDRCMQAIPVLDADGEPTGDYVFKEMGALRGLELMAKHFSLLTDKVQITNPVLEMLMKKLDGISHDDLRVFIRNVRASGGLIKDLRPARIAGSGK